MKIRNLISCALCGLTLFACSPSGGGKDREMDRFITDLMDRMTLREKLGQLNLPSGGDLVTGSVMNGELSDMIRKQEIGGFFNVKGIQKINALQHLAVEESRLKIPLLVGADVIHGYETIFPIPLALSCSWDTLAVERMARISAIEASADGINWTFSPMVDICRDARWGRIAEGNGEDPYLGSLMAKAYVRGYQGNNMQGNDEILACVKHFALYGASESGRDYNVVDMSRLRMYNEYLAPYKAAVDAGVGSVMSSFNIVDGIPATANKWLLTDLLRDEWGFGGLLVTDYNSIAEMSSHGVAPLKEASIRALQAGTDMDMVSCGFLNTLEESLKEGKVVTLPSVNTIADGTAVKRPGDLLFPYIQINVDDIITIEDSELIVAFLDMVENHKMIVENSGLLTVAALKHLDVKGKKIVSILSGGNMDVITMSSVIQNGLIQRDRIFTVSVLLPDKPGELVRVSQVIANENGNVIKLDHNQFFTTNRSAAVELRITMEAFGTDHKNRIVKALEEAGYTPKIVRPNL